jgi:plastocyanin
MKFVPERLEVAAGDRITWINVDFVPHSVTSTTVESGDLAQDGRWTWSAQRRGEMAYICRLHPMMRGVVIVK